VESRVEALDLGVASSFKDHSKLKLTRILRLEDFSKTYIRGEEKSPPPPLISVIYKEE
jgi:hypothetical protein